MKMFYSIGEVAEILDIPTSTVRFWEKHFDILRPKKSVTGHRKFSVTDLENLKNIYHLVKEKRMTLEGAKMRLKENPGAITRDQEIMDRLLRVRALLAEIREELRNDDDVVYEQSAPVESAEFVESLTKSPVDQVIFAQSAIEIEGPVGEPAEVEVLIANVAEEPAGIETIIDQIVKEAVEKEDEAETSVAMSTEMGSITKELENEAVKEKIETEVSSEDELVVREVEEEIANTEAETVVEKLVKETVEEKIEVEISLAEPAGVTAEKAVEKVAEESTEDIVEQPTTAATPQIIEQTLF